MLGFEVDAVPRTLSVCRHCGFLRIALRWLLELGLPFGVGVGLIGWSWAFGGA
jgi:hypothetical protein